MKVDLLTEAAIAASRVGGPELQRIRSLGVSAAALAQLAERQIPFGLQPIQPSADGLFEPVEDGPLSVIVPVMETRSIDWQGAATDVVEIIDLIAFSSRNPLRWHWRTGDGWALGLDLLHHDEPITVVADPLAWLAEGGNAFCLLDWSLPAQRWHMLRNVVLVTPDEMLRRRLNAAFAETVPPLVIEPSQWIYRNGRYVRRAA